MRVEDRAATRQIAPSSCCQRHQDPRSARAFGAVQCPVEGGADCVFGNARPSWLATRGTTCCLPSNRSATAAPAGATGSRTPLELPLTCVHLQSPRNHMFRALALPWTKPECDRFSSDARTVFSKIGGEWGRKMGGEMEYGRVRAGGQLPCCVDPPSSIGCDMALFPVLDGQHGLHVRDTGVVRNTRGNVQRVGREECSYH